MSIARRVEPSRLELKRGEGSSSAAPLAKVSFTTALYVSPVQRIPPCDQTGTPRHFHSSTASGSACLMSCRTRASVSPRQSLSSLILASISWEAGGCVSALLEAFILGACVAFMRLLPPCRLTYVGQAIGSPAQPSDELAFVELVVLADVQVAGALALGLAGRNGAERRDLKEGHFHGFREAMNAQERAPTLDAMERQVPFDCLTHAWRRFHDQRVEATSNFALPPRHGGDIGPHGGVALALGDLRIAAREERRRRGLTGLRFGSRALGALGALGQCLGRAHSSFLFGEFGLSRRRGDLLQALQSTRPAGGHRFKGNFVPRPEA